MHFQLEIYIMIYMIKANIFDANAIYMYLNMKCSTEKPMTLIEYASTHPRLLVSFKTRTDLSQINVNILMENLSQIQ